MGGSIVRAAARRVRAAPLRVGGRVPRTPPRHGQRPDRAGSASPLTTVLLVAGLLLGVLVVPVGSSARTTPTTGAEQPPAAAPISRGVPAFASGNSAAAARANDDDWGTEWRSAGGPGWLAYDLSSVPESRRQQVLAVYYNSSYGYSTRYGPHYNNWGSYRIESNDQPGNGGPPQTGWRVLSEVEGNDLHSRQHLVDLAGARWLRVVVTASDGSPQNRDAATGMFDVYDVSASGGGRPDNVIVFGDSITAGALCTCPSGSTPPVAEIIHRADPARWPVVENGGEPFQTSTDGVRTILGPDGHLSRFPGQYVGLAFGMNDAGGGTSAETYYQNMRRLVEGVLAVGKTPVLPLISHTGDAARNASIPAYNDKVRQLYEEFPGLVPGPDPWSSFQRDPRLTAPGDVHPSEEGYRALRQQWADALLAAFAVPATTPGSPDGAPSGLRVAGNALLDGRGQPVRLVGVNHSGTEYACVGGGTAGASGYGIFEPADFATHPTYLDAIRSWGANTVRIGLNEACWLGLNGVAPEFSGEHYQRALRDFVDRAAEKGLAVVLELHWSAPGDGAEFVPHGQSPMPNRDHSVRLWREVAATFRDEPTVVLDLFNEPYPHWNSDTDQAWQCWRDGSDPADPQNTSRCPGTEWWDLEGNAFNGGEGYVYEVAGMQELVDAVRAAGAPNLVLLSGVQYANSLSKWLEYRPQDPLDNLAPSWHVYPNNACADSTCREGTIAPVAAQVPLVVAEFGQGDCRGDFVAPLLTWLEEHAAGYLAWTWNAWGCEGMQLMDDYRTGAPTAYGRSIREHMLALANGPSTPTVPERPDAEPVDPPGPRQDGLLTLWPDTARPSVESVPDSAAVELGVRFRSEADGRLVGLRFYKGPRNTGPHTGSLWDSDGRRLATLTFPDGAGAGWQEARFPEPVSVRPGTTYTASYHTESGGYAAEVDYFPQQGPSGPLRVADSRSSVFRYGTSGHPTQTYRGTNYFVDVVFEPVDSTLWSGTGTPPAAAVPEATAVELGVRFRPVVDGEVVGVRFYRTTASTGPYRGSVWSSSGRRLASSVLSGASGAGWQDIAFPQPLPVRAGMTYTASYHAPNGHYVAAQEFFRDREVSAGSLVAPSGDNGVYRYGGGGFPSSSWRSTNYYVDVVFRASS